MFFYRETDDRDNKVKLSARRNTLRKILECETEREEEGEKILGFKYPQVLLSHSL